MRIYIISLVLLLFSTGISAQKPIVIVTTDINNLSGDPDDKQSLLHLLWYADEINIAAIIPDAWQSKGYEATMDDLEKYAADYTTYQFGKKGHPHPDTIRQRVMQDENTSVNAIIKTATESKTPVYILVWGSMETLKKALNKQPAIVNNIRVLTIATGVKYGPQDDVLGTDCNAVNWNGKGRNEIYNDPRFDKLWWIENNWTYNGMFPGKEPKEMLEKISRYGQMGAYMKNIVKDFAWAQYFRAGDTPTVLYLLNKKWIGNFTKPFPTTKPNYYTDASGKINWDYGNPCNSWQQAAAMYALNRNAMLSQRATVYRELSKKLNFLYKEKAL